jgi:hypothetical protein
MPVMKLIPVAARTHQVGRGHGRRFTVETAGRSLNAQSKAGTLDTAGATPLSPISYPRLSFLSATVEISTDVDTSVAESTGD